MSHSNDIPWWNWKKGKITKKFFVLVMDSYDEEEELVAKLSLMWWCQRSKTVARLEGEKLNFFPNTQLYSSLWFFVRGWSKKLKLNSVIQSSSNTLRVSGHRNVHIQPKNWSMYIFHLFDTLVSSFFNIV